MDIAIVVGVSKYSDAKNNLPGCKNDAEAIFKILSLTNKFNDILYINNDENSAKTKELISNFILKHKNNEIDELFFYYSGHGEFSNNEFYYILSDYDHKKKNQTTLQNKEIDDLIRTISPELTIKVVDACQSGTIYIKESDFLLNYFNSSKEGFNKCYFMSSSLNNQSSYQDNNISYFTFSFIKAIKEYEASEIRYRHIIDAISDEFLNNPEQTPLFVSQADLTEKFCTISSELKIYLSSFDLPIITSNESKTKLTLLEKVRENSKEYIDKNGALNILNLLKNEFSSIVLEKEIKEMYSLNINFLEDHTTVPKLDVISKWFDKDKGEYFGSKLFETTYDEMDGEYNKLIGFDLKFKVPFKAISIIINGQFPNIESYRSDFLFFMSKRQLRFFYFITNYIDQNWDERSLNWSGIKWTTIEAKITDITEIKEAIKLMLNSIENRIKKDIEEKFDDSPVIDDDLPF